MVTQAQEHVKYHSEESSQEANIQKIIDKHTKEMVVSVILISKLNQYTPTPSPTPTGRCKISLGGKLTGG